MSAAEVESRPSAGSRSTAHDTTSHLATDSSSHHARTTAGADRGTEGAGQPQAGGGRDRRRRNRGQANHAHASHGNGGADHADNAESAHGQRTQNSRGRGQGNDRSVRARASNAVKAGVDAAQVAAGPSTGNVAVNGAGPGRGGGRQRGPRNTGRDQHPAQTDAHDADAAKAAPISSRKRKFGGKITTNDASAATASGAHGDKGKAPSHAAPVPPQIREYADLRSRLIAELGSGQYECSICYNTLTTRQPSWSCDQCYTVLHLPCTKKWASTSVDQANAQLAMQEDPEMRARRGTWRCPGCQFAREDVPQAYWCWCGRVKDPQPRGGLNPHSCGQRCGKGSCPHGGCAEPCHPGPCAPCAVTVSKRCHCGKHVLPMRCSQLNPSGRSSAMGPPGIAAIAGDASASLKAELGISCSEPCGKPLNCSSHDCTDTCHPGPCSPCTQQITAKCYCGLEEKTLVCGSEGVAQTCIDEASGTQWMGLWACDTIQKRPYDCGKHFYEQACSNTSHTSASPPCPRSPDRVKTCPCGKLPLTTRTTCEDDIPTCGSKCEKVQPCGHLDSATDCHHGPCPPCTVPLTTPCRCGESKQTRPCHEHQREQSEGGQEILCSTLCKALRNCGKHVCNQRCCPLSFQAKAKGRRRPTAQELAAQDPAGFHECNVPCGKPLSCGSHSCPMTCHRGPCQRCLQASFEELICHCGRTVLEPPVACGAVIRCNFPCTRPPPACGHPKVEHNCHEDDACPPCVFLTERLCHCGKSVVQAVPCSRSTERVRCGMACGALMPCGFHRCEGHCHQAPAECGSCTQVCAKPRKSCGHPCTRPCHAPSSCPDSEPCETIITIQCPCGHLQQKSKCGASTLNPAGRERALKCNDACAIAQRNMKLADALGINYADKSAPATYDVETIKFYASHRAFGDEVERAFNDFIHSSRSGMILPAAKREHRKFTHELAAVYKLATESVDAEPKRSVSVRRLQGSRIPSPLLSEVWANALAEHGTVATAAAAVLGGGSAAGSTSSKLSTTLLDRNKASSASGTGGSGSSGATNPAANQPLNAILLEAVFGHSAASLREVLETLPGGWFAPSSRIKYDLRWVGDEDVLITFDTTTTAPSTSPPADLVRIRTSLRELLARTGLARRALLCVVGGKEREVLRTEEDAVPTALHSVGSSTSTAARPTGSSVGVVTPGRATGLGASLHAPASGMNPAAPVKKLGGWAAIASGAATTSSHLSSSRGGLGSGGGSGGGAHAGSTSVWDAGARRARGGPTSHSGASAGEASSGGGRIVLTTSAASSSSLSSNPNANATNAINGARASPPFVPANQETTPDDWETS